MKSQRSILIIIFFALFTKSLQTSSYAQEYVVSKSAANSVVFLSEAPIEDFEGLTQSIDGYLYLSPDRALDSSEFYFEVDLRTIDTGIGLRNRHMRENYLETDKFPYATFSGKITEWHELKDTIYVLVNGDMEIHGTVNNLVAEGKLIKIEKGFRIFSEFELKLTDYNIEIPSFMFFKISDIIRIKLNLFLTE